MFIRKRASYEALFDYFNPGAILETKPAYHVFKP